MITMIIGRYFIVVTRALWADLKHYESVNYAPAREAKLS